MNNVKLLFLHEHKVQFSYAFLKNNEYYISKFYELNKKYQVYTNFNKDTLFYVKCQECNKDLLQKENDHKLLFIPPNINDHIINIFNKHGVLLGIYLQSNKKQNLYNFNNIIRNIYYKSKVEYIENDSMIIIGTLDEKNKYYKSLYNQTKEAYDAIQKNNKGLIQLPKDRAEETYDIVISIKSMIGLSKEGWLIKYPNGKKEYLNKAKKKTMVVGVVGNGNKGKSFILGKLSDYKIPQGFTITTEGLSVRYGEREDHCIAILDSAGQEMPLLTNENIENMKTIQIKDLNNDKEENREISYFENCLRDKLITETFIQQFIIENAHILILVVGSITLNEQKILERVKKSLTPDKFLFVIHNLQNYQSKEQVHGYIENTIKKLFGIQVDEINFQNMSSEYHKKYYVEQKNNKITHLIFINDFCENAQYYNEPTLTFLKKKIEVEQNRVEFSVVERCKEFLIKIQSDFLENIISKKDFSNEEEDKIILKTNNDMKLKKVFIDEIGKTVTNYFDEPKYYYYTKGNEFIICIENPGKGASIEGLLVVNDEFYVFDFKGIRPGITVNNDVYRIHKNLKKETEFKLLIQIPIKDIYILPNTEGQLNWNEKSIDEGVFTFKYKIIEKTKNLSYK